MTLGFKPKYTRQTQPLITYQYIDKELENNEKERLNGAFDILFEEVLREKVNLTTMDS